MIRPIAKIIRHTLVLLAALSLAACAGKEEQLEEPISDDQEAAAPLSNSSLDDLMAPMENSAPAQMAPTNKWVIRYVKDTTDAFSAPDSANKAEVGFDRGDVLVVEIENDWARTPEGKYLKVDALSEKAVGRKRTGGAWKAP